MGYWIKKLENIPTHFSWYFFLIGDYRNHSFANDFFRKDFNIVADQIHENTALIHQNCQLQRQLQDSLKNVEGGELGKMIHMMEIRSPGLLIINKHPKLIDPFYENYEKKMSFMPKDLTDDQKKQYEIDAYNTIHCNRKIQNNTVVIYIPFDKIEKSYDNANVLMSDIVNFSKGISNEFIEKTAGRRMIKRINSYQLNPFDSSSVIAINYDEIHMENMLNPPLYQKIQQNSLDDCNRFPAVQNFNFYGGQPIVNTGRGEMNVTQNNCDIQQLDKAISELNDCINTMPTEMRDIVKECIEVVETLKTNNPKKALVKTALTTLKGIDDSVQFLAAVSALCDFCAKIL